jgi:hypothetical protein
MGYQTRLAPPSRSLTVKAPALQVELSIVNTAPPAQQLGGSKSYSTDIRTHVTDEHKKASTHFQAPLKVFEIAVLRIELLLKFSDVQD